MNKILMAAAVLLVSGTPVAFAMPNPTDMTTSELTTEHCPNLEQEFSHLTFPNQSAKQAAEQKAESVCRQDKHKNSGREWGGKAKPTSFVFLHG